jgi:hypothetical protein
MSKAEFRWFRDSQGKLRVWPPFDFTTDSVFSGRGLELINMSGLELDIAVPPALALTFGERKVDANVHLGKTDKKSYDVAGTVLAGSYVLTVTSLDGTPKDKGKADSDPEVIIT